MCFSGLINRSYKFHVVPVVLVSFANIQPLSGKTKEKLAGDFYQVTKLTSTRVLLCPSKLCIQVFVVLQLDVQVCVRVV